MTAFFETIHCLSRAHCETCRNFDKGRLWRERILRIFKTSVANADFECPFGVCWNDGRSRVEKPVETVNRPRKTAQQVKSLGQAIISGKYVAKDVLDERVAICGKCEFLRVAPNGDEWCGICGCKASAEDRKITNLAAYEENLPMWGCKHSKRKTGFGWKR